MENQNNKSENQKKRPREFNPIWGLIAMGILITVILLAEVLWIKK